LISCLLSGIVGGAVAVGATVLIERLGGRIGGIISASPHLVVIGIYGILEESESPAKAEKALFSIPLGVLTDIIFLAVWQYVPALLPITGVHKRLIAMVIISMTVWAAWSVALVFSMEALEDSFDNAVVVTGSVCSALALLGGVLGSWFHLDEQEDRQENEQEHVQDNELKVREETNTPNEVDRGAPDDQSPEVNDPKQKDEPQSLYRSICGSVPVWMLLARFVLAGGAMASVTYLASLGLEVLAGLFAVFPAMFLTATVSVWLSRGESVQRVALGPLGLGVSSVTATALCSSSMAVRPGQLQPIVLVVFLAWLAAVVGVTVPAFLFLQWRQDVNSRAGTQLDEGVPNSKLKPRELQEPSNLALWDNPESELENVESPDICGGVCSRKCV